MSEWTVVPTSYAVQSSTTARAILKPNDSSNEPENT